MLTLGKVTFETKPDGNQSCGVGGLAVNPSMPGMRSSAEGLLQAHACAFSSSPTPASLDFFFLDCSGGHRVICGLHQNQAHRI